MAAPLFSLFFLTCEPASKLDQYLAARAAGFLPLVGGAVGLAMVAGDPVDAAYIETGRWEVDIAGRIYPAEVSLKPLYDPGMTRIKA
jgi:4-methylaminobutanoate oxidase (formaldehyde-forming)